MVRRRAQKRSEIQRHYNLETLEPRCLLAADVFIAEFLASNDGVLLDEDGNDSDWLEIFNAGPDDTNLDGWHLTDDEDDLSKWDFPNTPLAAGESIIVFASGEDRDESGRELHTNFKLSAGGEYLALTRDDAGGRVEVVSEFAPEFPQQVTDISYGFTQEVEVDELTTNASPASLLIPVAEPDADWNTVDFDAAVWSTVDAAIGYQNTVPGFTVQVAESTGSIVNLSEALAVLDGENQASVTTAISPTLNFRDPEGGGGSGRYDEDFVFPNDTPGDDNDFAVRATGTITVTRASEYTFHTNSDDGIRLIIDGVTVIDDDTLHAPQDRLGVIDLSEGLHDVELIYFERGGGAEFELSSARRARTSWGTVYRLVGDAENGGFAVETNEAGGVVGFSTVYTTDIKQEMQDQASSAYVRVPFNLEDASEFEALTLKMHYDGGFVAYLNGQEVARRNAPDVLSFDATATGGRSNPLVAEFITISEHVSLLQDGENVLAIQGLNQSADDAEFLLAAELVEIETSTGDPVYFREPTPGTFNASTGVLEFLLDDITFSEDHGFFEEPFELTIDSASAGTTIRYTLDGTEPTDTNGILYQGPFAVDSTSTIRARSFKPDVEPSRVETATYLFLEDVLQQGSRRPDNWPTSLSQTMNYGMDPDIVESRTWGPQMIESLTQVPTMSVTIDPNDFLGSTGIYSHAGSHGRAWERPATLELINPDGSEGFNVNMGLRIRGGFSRSNSNPKHAFRLFFRDEYGDAKLNFPLFGDEGTDQFDKIDLRTTQNYSWAFQGDSRNTFLRDIYSRDVQGMMGQPYTRGEYYHLYINGLYWGLFQTEERPEARYAASYFGGDSDDYDVVKSAGSSGGYQNEATDGTLAAYQELARKFYQNGGLGDENVEEYWSTQGMNPDGTRNPAFKRLLDVENLIDYMIITYFTSDADGPGSKFTRPRVNNYFGIFNRANPDGFKFFEHDSEHSLDTGNAAGANYNMVTPLTTGGSELRYFNPHWMHEQLARTNTLYREQFADRVYESMFNDGILTPEKSKALIDSRAAEFDMAIIAESARWGDSKRSTPYTKTTWESAVNRLKNWFDGRVDVVINQFQRQDWYPDAQPPQFAVNGQLQHGGEVEAGDNISVNTATSFSFETVMPRGSIWKYLDDGSNQGTAWRDPDFDDSAWEEGEAELGYGDGTRESTVVSFGPNSDSKYVTTYFRRDFEIESTEGFEGARILLRRDDGAIVYLNGEEVARQNMPGGEVAYDQFATSVVAAANESTYFEIDIPRSQLRVGENTFAVEIHQVNASSSDISFDLELELGKLNLNDTGVWYTTDGSDPKQPNGEVSPTAIPYTGFIRLAESGDVKVRVLNDTGWSVLNSANFIVSNVPGDLNADGAVDHEDIDLLSAAIREGSEDPLFDLNNSDSVDTDDLTTLVEDILQTRRGDTDLDGDVDFGDFVTLSGKFGAANAGWQDGDSNGDALIDFDDFLALAGNFGFERPAAALPFAQQLTPLLDAGASEPEDDLAIDFALSELLSEDGEED